MNIQIGRTNSEPNRLDKVFTVVKNIQGNLNHDSNVINPTIVFEYDEALVGCNYAYIPAWNRYYYITDIRIINQTIMIAFHVDVLKTYSSNIKGSVAHITRSSKGNKYIPDPLATQTENRSWQFRSLGTGLQAGVHYIITKAGI